MSSVQASGVFAADATRFSGATQGSYYALAGQGGGSTGSGVISINGQTGITLLQSAGSTINVTVPSPGVINLDATPNTVGVTSIGSSDNTVTVTSTTGGVVNLSIPSGAPIYSTIGPQLGGGGPYLNPGTTGGNASTRLLNFSTTVGQAYQYGYDIGIGTGNNPGSVNGGVSINPTWFGAGQPGSGNLVKGGTIQATQAIAMATSGTSGPTYDPSPNWWTASGTGILVAQQSTVSFGVTAYQAGATGSYWTTSTLWAVGTQAGNLPITSAYLIPVTLYN
jgi:hypothetical protein